MWFTKLIRVNKWNMIQEAANKPTRVSEGE